MPKTKLPDMPALEHKKIPALMVKIVDEPQGIVEELFAVTGNIDFGKDIIDLGAGTKTIAERLGQVLVLDAHNTGSALDVIGKCLEIREVGRNELPQDIRARYPDATGGYLAKTQYLMDTPEGLGVFNRIRSGALKERSFGFNIVNSIPDKVKAKKTTDGWVLDPNGDDLTVRRIKEFILYEYSPVPFGMNSATATVSVKDKDGGEPDEDKATVPYQSLPLADKEHAWDASGARKRMADAAGGKDDLDTAKYKKGFLWFDADNADTQGAYKFPIADIVDGKLTAIPKGIFAAAGALDGARGGSKIPSADQASMKTHLAKYYKAMASKFDDDSISPPWDKEKAFSLTEMIEDVCNAFCAQYPGKYVREVWSEFVIIASMEYGGGMYSDCTYYRVGFTLDVDGGYIFDAPSAWVEGEYVFTASAPAETATTPEDDTATETGDLTQATPDTTASLRTAITAMEATLAAMKALLPAKAGGVVAAPSIPIVGEATPVKIVPVVVKQPPTPPPAKAGPPPIVAPTDRKAEVERLRAKQQKQRTKQAQGVI